MKYYTIEIPFSESDLQELMDGSDFEWSWTTKEDENIVIITKLRPEQENEWE